MDVGIKLSCLRCCAARASTERRDSPGHYCFHTTLARSHRLGWTMFARLGRGPSGPFPIRSHIALHNRDACVFSGKQQGRRLAYAGTETCDECCLGFKLRHR